MQDTTLANALDGLGEYQRAAELHEQTLAARERILGPEHPDTLKSRNLAEALRRAQEGPAWIAVAAPSTPLGASFG